MCRPIKEPCVGDNTPQGEILEIKKDKALINGSVNKDGKWCDKKKWVKLKDIILSVDYEKYHKIRDDVDKKLAESRNTLIQDFSTGLYGSWGIFSDEVDDTCRISYDISQVIRHEKWKIDDNRSNITVDSSIFFSHRKDNSSNDIKCFLNETFLK
jgi:hypothetical protein